MREAPPSITCPRCARVSYHPNDIRERYCGACHLFHDQMRTYRPDHNGECLNCDEHLDGHTADGRCLPPEDGIGPLTDKQVDAFLTAHGNDPDDPERRRRIRAIFDQKRGTDDEGR